MLPYILLILLPLPFCYVAWGETKDRTPALHIGRSPYVREHNMALPVFFLLLFLMLALRAPSIGRDLGNYLYYFESFAQQNLKDLLAFETDALYGLLNWAVGQFTDNYQWFLAVVAALCVLPVAALYRQERRHGYLQLIIFVNLSTFVMLFSGLRQALAMAVGVMAYRCVRKKQLFRFLLWVLVALGFHHSGFILLAMYPLYHITFRRKHLLFVVPVMGAIFVFNKPIFAVATAFFSRFEDVYEGTITDTGAYTMLILFVIFAAFSYVVPDEEKLGPEGRGLRNILLAALVIQCFVPLHNLAMRMGYYYMIFIPILMAKVVDASRVEYRQIARLGNYVMCIFFTLYYLWGVYQGCTTGISALDTMPYVPFWRD